MITQAWAQEAMAAGAEQPGLLANMVPLILIIVVFYFFMIRPQQKRLRDHQQMVEGLRRGDKVVTAGGIVGTVSKVENDEHVMVDISPDVRVKIVRSTITHVLDRTNPANDTGEVKKKPAQARKKKSESA
jgi:preprotein translocase subunit YajC